MTKLIMDCLTVNNYKDISHHTFVVKSETLKSTPFFLVEKFFFSSKRIVEFEGKWFKTI